MSGAEYTEYEAGRFATNVVIKGIGIGLSNTPTIYNIVMTNADTEYSLALPTNTKILHFRCQDNTITTRFSFITGKVATPTAPYRTLFAGEIRNIERLNIITRTLYIACGIAGHTMEIEAWV